MSATSSSPASTATPAIIQDAYPRHAELMGTLTATVSLLPPGKEDLGAALLEEMSAFAAWKRAQQ